MIYVRKIDEEKDRLLIANWLANDPEHQALGIKVEDFFESGTEAAIVFDDNGPRMIIRFHKALRAAVQFNPETPLANARIGKDVREWFENLAVDMGAKEVIIRPGGKAVRFTERLGFENFDGKFIKV